MVSPLVFINPISYIDFINTGEDEVFINPIKYPVLFGSMRGEE